MRLGDVLQVDFADEAVDDDSTYPLAGVYGFGRGVFTKNTIQGAETKYKTLRRLKVGQLIFSKLKAFEGAVALVPDEADGCYVSHEFPTFSLSPAIHPRYAAHLVQWDGFVERMRAKSSGVGARRERLHPDDFCSIVIPLPDLDDQRRIATHLDFVSDHVHSVRERWGREGDAIDVLFAARSTADLVPLGELVKQVRRPKLVEPDVTYSMLGMRWNGGGLFERNVISGRGISAKQVYEVMPGDLVYNRLFAWKRSFGLAASENAGGTVSNEFPTFVVDTDSVAPRFLLAQLLGCDFTEAVNAVSTVSTPTSRNRLKEQQFLGLTVPVPAMSRQRRAVAYLTKLDELASHREDAMRIIDALDAAARNEIFSAMV